MKAKLVVHPVLLVFSHGFRDDLGLKVAEAGEGLILTTLSVL